MNCFDCKQPIDAVELPGTVAFCEPCMIEREKDKVTFKVVKMRDKTQDRRRNELSALKGLIELHPKEALRFAMELNK